MARYFNPAILPLLLTGTDKAQTVFLGKVLEKHVNNLITIECNPKNSMSVHRITIDTPECIRDVEVGSEIMIRVAPSNGGQTISLN